MWMCVSQHLRSTDDENRWCGCPRYLLRREHLNRLSLPTTHGSVIPSNPPSSLLRIGNARCDDVEMTYPTKEDKHFVVFFEQLRLGIEWQFRHEGATACRTAERLLEQQDSSVYPHQPFKV